MEFSLQGYNLLAMDIKSFFEKHLDNYLGVLIILNILHQIISSMAFMENRENLVLYGGMFLQISMYIFAVELVFRVFSEKRLGFLSGLDLLVLLNYFFVGLIDLRVFRMFRAFQIFSQTRILLPANTLFKTIKMQRHALLGSMVLVLSILLVFSTLMYFVEGDDQPIKLGSIPLALWWGMETLTTVGYGDVHPVTGPGRVLGSLIMLLGIAMFALPAAILGSAYYEEIQKRNFLVSLEAITEIPIFAQLPINAIGKINEKLEVVLLPAKKVIFEKGDEADSMYIIEIGRVEINLDPNPPAIKDQGDFFGEMGLVSDNPRMATVTTLDEVKLLQLKKEDLNELIEEHPVIFQEIEEKISTYS
ncbi:MAG: cyclic nucleotide-gated ion channel [SAR86 cluster bacterium]|nr:cyclic nucleotide-gated ion channel [SAR86 cluster bacterium]